MIWGPSHSSQQTNSSDSISTHVNLNCPLIAETEDLDSALNSCSGSPSRGSSMKNVPRSSIVRKENAEALGVNKDVDGDAQMERQR